VRKSDASVVACRALLATACADLSGLQGGGSPRDAAAADRSPGSPDAGDAGNAIDVARPAEVDASAGTMISESFEVSATSGCGNLWTPDNSTLSLASPGHGDATACLVCTINPSKAYGLISASLMLTVSSSQTLVASAFVVAATADGGASATPSGGGSLEVVGNTAAGAPLGGISSQMNLMGSWQPMVFNYTPTQELHGPALWVPVSNETPGACCLVDDITLHLQ